VAITIGVDNSMQKMSVLFYLMIHTILKIINGDVKVAHLTPAKISN
jgi:hypothetical protein